MIIKKTEPFTKGEIQKIRKDFGNYVKITSDLEKEWIAVGCKLHADGEKVLLDDGSSDDNIWGGGLNLKDKIIDTTAVLNIRPRFNNDSMEILDTQRREKFIAIARNYFNALWD